MSTVVKRQSPAGTPVILRAASVVSDSGHSGWVDPSVRGCYNGGTGCLRSGRTAMDSIVLETVIGLVFIFGTFAVLVSLSTELVARFIGLRGEYLLRGVRTLVDGQGHFRLSLGDLFARTAGKPAPKM